MLNKFGQNMKAENTDVNNLVFKNRGIAKQLYKTLLQPDKIEQTRCKSKENLIEQNGVRRE